MAEGWSRDVTAEIAKQIRDQAARSGEELPPDVDFIEYEAGPDVRLGRQVRWGAMCHVRNLVSGKSCLKIAR